MSKKMKCWGREYIIDRDVEFMAFIPEGETEVHIWAGGVFIGTVRELKSFLRMVEDNVRPVPDAGHARIRSDDGSVEVDLTSNKVTFRASPMTVSHDGDLSLKPIQREDLTAGIEAKISLLNAEIGEIRAGLLAAEEGFFGKVVDAVRKAMRLRVLKWQ